MKKAFALLFAILLCLSCFIACGDDSSTVTTTANGSNNPSGGDDTPGFVNPITLLDDKTFDGRTCTIWYKNDFGPTTDLYTEEPGIAAVDRASFKRLQTIYERTGVTVEGIKSTNQSSAMGSPDGTYLRDLFQADDPENIPDIVMPGGYVSSILQSQGYFLDLYDNPYIDLDKKCWQAQVNDNLSVCGTYFAVSGTYSTSNIGETACLYLDKTALATIDPSTLAGTAAEGFVDADTIYQWVRDGVWTYPKLLALAAAFAGEEGSIETPGVEGENDKYGFEFQGTSSYCIFQGTGKHYVAMDDATWLPTLMTDDPETVKVIDWIIENIESKPYVHDAGGGDGVTGRSYFGLGHQTLFTKNHVRSMSGYSEAGSQDGGSGTFDFAILPFPKFDYSVIQSSTQEDNYYCALNSWFATLAAVPANCTDTDFSSFVLELITEMGYYAWADGVTTLWAAYVEDGLDGRYAPNDNDVEMLYLILDAQTADMGEFNVWAGQNIANSIRDIIRGKKIGGATSWTASNKNAINLAIQDMLINMQLVDVA